MGRPLLVTIERALAVLCKSPNSMLFRQPLYSDTVRLSTRNCLMNPILRFFFALAMLALAIPTRAATTLVPLGSTWKYFIGTQEASSPDPAAWRAVGFN